jgi:hypothetical protein
MKLPENASPEQYKEFYDQLEPDKQTEFRKAGLLTLINTIYTDKAQDVIEDDEPKPGTVSSGIFIDKDSEYGKFNYELKSSGDDFVLNYLPIK